MKRHATDSPDALARILALSMIVDGHLSPAELRALDGAPFLERAGVDADTFERAVHELCDELLQAAPLAGEHVEIDAAMLDRVLDEIADPLLQVCMFRTMQGIVHADGMLDEREHLLVRRAARRWFRYADAPAPPARRAH